MPALIDKGEKGVHSPSKYAFKLCAVKDPEELIKTPLVVIDWLYSGRKLWKE